MNNLRNQLSDLQQPNVLMGVGIPGSGKLTLLLPLAEDLDYTYICPDNIREELTGSEANQFANSEVWGRTYELARTALEAQRSIIVDATHAEARRRPETIKLYRSFGALSVVALYLKVPLSRAMAQNNERDRVVPDRVLRRMHASLTTSPPSMEEGFDRVIAINH